MARERATTRPGPARGRELVGVGPGPQRQGPGQRPLAGNARLRRLRPPGALGDGAGSYRSPPTTTSGWRRTPRCSPPPTRPSTGGARGHGASRLVSGSRPVHTQLEQALADWKATEAAIVFPTGYAANLGTLSALAGPQVLICSDEHNHASIIDGCRLARVPWGARWSFSPMPTPALSGACSVALDGTGHRRHRRRLLHGRRRRPGRRTGAGLCRPRRPARAGRGPLGPGAPRRPAAVRGPAGGDPVKDTGQPGGFRGRRPGDDRNAGQPGASLYLHHGAGPADAAAAQAALEVLRSAEGAALVQRLEGYAGRFRRPEARRSRPSCPIIVGTERAALEASAALLDEGLFVPAIRPPTVPPGRSRLRVTPVRRPHR